jgi:LPXTG-motif cell wall-anchored protein
LEERWLSSEAGLLVRSGNSTKARSRLEELGTATTAVGVLASARVLLLLGDVPAAMATRDQVEAVDHPPRKVDAALLDVFLAVAAGDQEGALERLEDAVAAAAPWTLRRAFLVDGSELRTLLERLVDRGTAAPAFALELLERMSGSPLPTRAGGRRFAQDRAACGRRDRVGEPLPRGVDLVGAMLSVLGMGGVVLGVLVWQEGGEFVGALMVMGVAAIVGLGFWLVRRKRRERPALLDPDLFRYGARAPSSDGGSCSARSGRPC